MVEDISLAEFNKYGRRITPFILCFSNGNDLICERNRRLIEEMCSIFKNVLCYRTDWARFMHVDVEIDRSISHHIQLWQTNNLKLSIKKVKRKKLREIFAIIDHKCGTDDSLRLGVFNIKVHKAKKANPNITTKMIWKPYIQPDYTDTPDSIEVSSDEEDRELDERIISSPSNPSLPSVQLQKTPVTSFKQRITSATDSHCISFPSQPQFKKNLYVITQHNYGKLPSFYAPQLPNLSHQQFYGMHTQHFPHIHYNGMYSPRIINPLNTAYQQLPFSSQSTSALQPQTLPYPTHSRSSIQTPSILPKDQTHSGHSKSLSTLRKSRSRSPNPTRRTPSQKSSSSSEDYSTSLIPKAFKMHVKRSKTLSRSRSIGSNPLSSVSKSSNSSKRKQEPKESGARNKQNKNSSTRYGPEVNTVYLPLIHTLVRTLTPPSTQHSDESHNPNINRPSVISFAKGKSQMSRENPNNSNSSKSTIGTQHQNPRPKK